MVDFSKSINNEDMVAGLNKLVRLNADVLASLDRVPESLSNGEPARVVRELSTMHERHIRRIADTVHVLGGAAAGPDWRRWISESKITLGRLSKDKGVLKAIHSEEENLRAEYAHTLDQLSASPEVVSVINEILDDGQQVHAWLDTLIGTHH